MGKQTLMEWQYPEEPGEWEGLTQPSAALTVRPALSRRTVWGGLLALAVLLGAGGGWLWHTAHAGLATLETEIDDAVNADLWAEHQDAAAVQLVDLAGDVAVVEVALPAAAGMPLLHQTRVYRQTETGWTRTAPTAAMWGQPRRLETNHFVFAYYEQDEAAVKAAAVHLERLYPTLYAAFFGDTSAPQKHVIEVDPAHVPGDFAIWMKHKDSIVVASPAAYLAPGDLTSEALLTQSIVLALLDRIEFQMGMALAAYRSGYDEFTMQTLHWPIVNGVTLWQLWSTDLPLAQWREPVVQWVFDTTPLALGQPYIEPLFTPELCAMHKLWMETPLYLQLPFACDARFEDSQWVQIWLRSAMLRRSAQLPLTERYLTGAETTIYLTRETALATAMEYAAATYGQERIPRLLEAMSKHGRWETLVLEVFGVSAEQFEAGWADYLATHYGVDVSNHR